MAALYLILVAASVVSLVSEALAGCVAANWGRRGQSAIMLDTVEVNIARGTNVLVDLPLDRLVPGCEVVGVEAEFCEGNDLIFVNKLTVLAEFSEAYTSAKVNSVVHCTLVNNDGRVINRTVTNKNRHT